MERDASEHVDPAAVRLADLVLVGEEAHAKQRLKVTLDQLLQRRRNGPQAALQLLNGVALNAE
jgi:hypothetical protein